MNGLIGFLTENCCAGVPCSALAGSVGPIRNAGIEPVVVEDLAHPPDRATLLGLIARAGLPVRAAVREKGTQFTVLGLDDPATTDVQLVDAMLAHPVLINRPFVATPHGVRLCRPSELVLDILPAPQRGAFIKEDGEAVVDTHGKRIK